MLLPRRHRYSRATGSKPARSFKRPAISKPQALACAIIQDLSRRLQPARTSGNPRATGFSLREASNVQQYPSRGLQPARTSGNPRAAGFSLRGLNAVLAWTENPLSALPETQEKNPAEKGCEKGFSHQERLFVLRTSAHASDSLCGDCYELDGSAPSGGHREVE